MPILSLEEIQGVSLTQDSTITSRPTTTRGYGVSVAQGSMVAPDEVITEDRLLILTDVVRNIWQSYKYHQEYESFLLGACSEAEFLAASERYATSFRSIPAQSLVFASLLLLNVLDSSLSSSDLSVLLNVDPFDIEQSLSASAASGAITTVRWDANGEQR